MNFAFGQGIYMTVCNGRERPGSPDHGGGALIKKSQTFYKI